jgi:hypothetical protein
MLIVGFGVPAAWIVIEECLPIDAVAWLTLVNFGAVATTSNLDPELLRYGEVEVKTAVALGVPVGSFLVLHVAAPEAFTETPLHSTRGPDVKVTFPVAWPWSCAAPARELIVAVKVTGLPGADGFGVAVTTVRDLATSKAPTSQPLPCERLTPRWSVLPLGQSFLCSGPQVAPVGIVSISALGTAIETVGVGPP